MNNLPPSQSALRYSPRATTPVALPADIAAIGPRVSGNTVALLSHLDDERDALLRARIIYAAVAMEPHR
jgi:hypothetical protein